MGSFHERDVACLVSDPCCYDAALNHMELSVILDTPYQVSTNHRAANMSLVINILCFSVLQIHVLSERHPVQCLG